MYKPDPKNLTELGFDETGFLAINNDFAIMFEKDKNVFRFYSPSSSFPLIVKSLKHLKDILYGYGVV